MTGEQELRRRNFRVPARVPRASTDQSGGRAHARFWQASLAGRGFVRTADIDTRLLGLVAAHIMALHEVGSNNPDGVEIVEHVRCASRGEGICEWRAEWRPVDRK